MIIPVARLLFKILPSARSFIYLAARKSLRRHLAKKAIVYSAYTKRLFSKAAKPTAKRITRKLLQSNTKNLKKLYKSARKIINNPLSPQSTISIIQKLIQAPTKKTILSETLLDTIGTASTIATLAGSDIPKRISQKLTSIETKTSAIQNKLSFKNVPIKPATKQTKAKPSSSSSGGRIWVPTHTRNGKTVKGYWRTR